MDSPRTRGEGATSSGVEAWSVTMVLSEPWPRPGRGAWGPDRRGACVEAVAGPDGHYAQVSLRTRRRRKDVSAAQVSLMHGSRWPRGGTASPSTWGTAATTSPAGPEGTGPSSSGLGVGAGLDVLAPGDRPRGPGEDLLSRVAGADAAQPGVEGLPHRRWTTRAIRAHRFPAPGLPALSRAGGAGRFLRRQPVATGSA